MENPDDDPRRRQYCIRIIADLHGPMYLVSPQLLVTREHIISARASSSLLSPLGSFSGSGDAVPLLGLGSAGCTGVPSVVGATDARLSSIPLSRGVADCPALSVNRFSNVARSVLPSSSSGMTPDRRMSVSMRAKRFSKPSMYLALLLSALPSLRTPSYVPFRWLPLLLYLCEDAFRLVVLAVCARGHLAVALDLLLPAHITRLPHVSIIRPTPTIYV
jgi:hypothetical protein